MPVSAAVAQALVAIEGELAQVVPRLSWTAPGAMHLTLKFLGQVPEVRVDEIAAAVRSALFGVRPFEIEVSGLGGFPDVARPRVLWAGVGAGAPELARVAAAVDRALLPLGFPLEERGFTAHVTLARVKEKLEAAVEAALTQALAAGARRPVGRVAVDRVDLMKTNGGGVAEKYTPLGSFALGAD